MGAASAAGKRGAGAGPVLRRGARTCGLVACVAAYALFLPAWRLLGSDSHAVGIRCSGASPCASEEEEHFWPENCPRV
jgi:hypothetical protein